MLLSRQSTGVTSASEVGARPMDLGLDRPHPSTPTVISPIVNLHFADNDDEEDNDVGDSPPPTPRLNGDRHVHSSEERSENERLRDTEEGEIKDHGFTNTPNDRSAWMISEAAQTSESECQTLSEGPPDPSLALPLDDNFLNFPARRSNGEPPTQRGDHHIAAILRDARRPQEAARSPVRSPSPTRPKLTHYSSADEILQRFSEKWKKYQEMTNEQNDQEKVSEAPVEAEMPGARRRIPASSTKPQKRPSELELLRQENARLKKRLGENEEYVSEKVSSLTIALDEGKKLWEKANKENVELRARADVDSLKMQRMEERIRMLESGMRSSEDENSFMSDMVSLRRVVEMQDKELEVLRKEVELYQKRQKPPTFPPSDQDAWKASLDLQLPREDPSMTSTAAATSPTYTRMPAYTMGGIVMEEKLPKQYRSTGDLRLPGQASTLPRSSHASRERPGTEMRSNGGYNATSPMAMPSKIFWIDDPPPEEPPRRSHPEPTFEPPKVHPMIARMATKRKRQERSKTIGGGELQRSRSSDRAPSRSVPQQDDRPKPAWIQRVLSLRKGQTEKPPSGDRNRSEPQARVYCRGRPVREVVDEVEIPDVRPPSREGHREREEERPPTSVLIESIRQRVREFNLASNPQEARRDHGPADGRRSVDFAKERRRDESPQRMVRPASSMELGHHVGSRGEYQNPLVSDHRNDQRVGNEENVEDEALKYRVQQKLDRRGGRHNSGSESGSGYQQPAEEQSLRPPAHGPIRALHTWNGHEEADRWEEDVPEPRVPPLDLSKLKPDKIAQGTGLPTDMRNYADELIKKYMSSLAANAE